MRFRALVFVSALAAILPLSWQAPAHADVLFGLNNVVFDDGGTAGGTFELTVYGYPSGVADLFTTAGSVFGDATYTSYPAEYNSQTTFVVSTSDPDTALDLTFADPLDAIVGLTDTLVTGGASYEECIDPNGCTWGSQFVAENTVRDIVSGYAQIPEPASLAMLGVGLFGLGMARRFSAAR